jgi:hypothetical protein
MAGIRVLTSTNICFPRPVLDPDFSVQPYLRHVERSAVRVGRCSECWTLLPIAVRAASCCSSRPCHLRLDGLVVLVHRHGIKLLTEQVKEFWHRQRLFRVRVVDGDQLQNG